MKVQDLDTGNEFLWNKNRFLNRQVHMQQMYQSFEEGGSPEPVDKVTSLSYVDVLIIFVYMLCACKYVYVCVRACAFVRVHMRACLFAINNYTLL